MPRKGEGIYGGNGGGVNIPSGEGKRRSKPIMEKTKSVSYNATTSDAIFAISADAGSSATESMPGAVEIENTGNVSIFLMAGYRSYSDDTSDVATDYLHVLLPPGEIFNPPVRAVISDNADNTIMFGTAVDNLAPDSNEFTDSGADTTEGFADDNDTTITFDDGSGAVAHLMFKVNDLIRLDNEVCRITSIVDTAGDGAYTPAHFIVERAVHGTAKADHTNNTNIRLPFFNAYHDFDKYTVAQTDANGKFKCFNFFGQGRSATESQGIIPGSFSVKFYNPGYQSLGLSGITSSTNSGLTASETLKLDITVDGGTLFQDLTFTLDSSNVNFGGTNGVISKIQSALDVQYYTAGNLFEKKVTVGIVNGDIRFTSGSHLSTSAILLADTGDSDTLIDAAANGRIPASGDIPAAIAAKLPEDVLYDRITYTTSPNTGAFGYDNGDSRLFGMCSGTINYETGAIDMTGCPPNAEFVVSALTNSAFSGRLNEGVTDRINSLVSISANTPATKGNGSVQVRTY